MSIATKFRADTRSLPEAFQAEVLVMRDYYPFGMAEESGTKFSAKQDQVARYENGNDGASVEVTSRDENLVNDQDGGYQIKFHTPLLSGEDSIVISEESGKLRVFRMNSKVEFQSKKGGE